MPRRRTVIDKQVNFMHTPESDASIIRLKTAPKYAHLTESDLWRLAAVKLAELLPATPRNR